jgi:ABC-type transport system substrate-binding protein
MTSFVKGEEVPMRQIRPQTMIALALLCLLALPVAGAAESPSFDAHRETTFALIHPIAPFYSTLMRVNPEHPASSPDFVGDLALDVPEPTDGGTTYTFKLRQNATFWDGQPVTAYDVVATFNKIIFPPEGVRSLRKAYYSIVDKVYATDGSTVVVAIQYPSSAFLPALAATPEELQEIAGYWPDLEQSRTEARRLLREAGVPDGLSFKFNIRDTDQPYKIVGLWLITQWRSIGLNPEQWGQPLEAYYKALRSRTTEYAVSIDYNCEAVVHPLLDVSKFISNDRSDSNWANYQDRVLDELFATMNRTADVAEQRRLMRRFEKRILAEQAHTFITLWWYRIVPHRASVRGWKISPSHYQNQDLANVWLAP